MLKETLYVAQPGSAGFGRWIEDRLVSAFDTLAMWRERAASRRRLSELDDRMLADIGHGRSDVHAEIERPFWTP